MDSCPRACQSERDLRGVRRSHLALAGRDSKRAAAERRKQGPRAAVVATAERVVARIAVGRAVGVPMPVRAAAAQPREPAVRERAGERRKLAELPRRADCRKTSRICWWAG